ncbi:unnamed protein product, partial [marine sediment metagenome]
MTLVARLDFEEGDLSDWDHVDGAGIVATSLAAYTGNYGCRSVKPITTQYEMWKNVSLTTEVTSVTYIRYNSLAGAQSDIYEQLRFEGITTKIFIAIRLNNSTGFFRIGYFDGGVGGSTTWEDTTTVFALATWYKITMILKIGAGDGYCTWKINDVEIASKTGLDNVNGYYPNQYYVLEQTHASTKDRDNISIYNTVEYSG